MLNLGGEQPQLRRDLGYRREVNRQIARRVGQLHEVGFEAVAAHRDAVRSSDASSGAHHRFQQRMCG
ncbi:hypothetical protein ACQPZ2_36880 [Nocardia pseudovaccinii]|uniref:hypothetical protein n=1 Tax=Nocardia pseudovaccinii TaxID=189540 RepID=UPI003D9192B8